MNTNVHPISFTLEGLDDLNKLPFAPQLKALITDRFTQVWQGTAHKIYPLHVEDAAHKMGYDFHWETGGNAVIYRGYSPNAVIQAKKGEFSLFQDNLPEKDAELYILPVMQKPFPSCEFYVPVQWSLRFEGMDFVARPGLKVEASMGSNTLDFAKLLWYVRASFEHDVNLTADVLTVALDDHPEYAYALNTEARRVMKDRVAALAAKNDLYVIGEDEKAVPAQFVAFDSSRMREILAALGYAKHGFKMPEEKILALAQATLEAEEA